jgi:hypothetical protein
MSIKLGEVCEHGTLKRKCDLCDAHDHIELLEEAVATLARMYYNVELHGFDRQWVESRIGGITNDIARAAVEKARKA